MKCNVSSQIWKQEELRCESETSANNIKFQSFRPDAASLHQRYYMVKPVLGQEKGDLLIQLTV